MQVLETFEVKRLEQASEAGWSFETMPYDLGAQYVISCSHLGSTADGEVASIPPLSGLRTQYVVLKAPVETI
jgi:hypothetical protein